MKIFYCPCNIILVTNIASSLVMYCRTSSVARWIIFSLQAQIGSVVVVRPTPEHWSTGSNPIQPVRLFLVNLKFVPNNYKSSFKTGC